MTQIPDFTVATVEEADTSIAAGDRVRSYDTAYQDNSYVEGVVCDVGYELAGCPRYVIEADRRVCNGEEQSKDKLPSPPRFYPPVNGTPSLLGQFTNGVRRLAA